MVFPARGLNNLGNSPKTEVLHQSPESIPADKPLADMVMPVDPRSAWLFAVIRMKKSQMLGADQTVKFGTSGHRGSSLANKFNEDHILAIC